MTPNGRSTLRNEAFRAAAHRMVQKLEFPAVVPAYGNVDRPMGGGGWVDVQMWVPEEEAAKEAGDADAAKS